MAKMDGGGEKKCGQWDCVGLYYQLTKLVAPATELA